MFYAIDYNKSYTMKPKCNTYKCMDLLYLMISELAGKLTNIVNLHGAGKLA